MTTCDAFETPPPTGLVKYVDGSRIIICTVAASEHGCYFRLTPFQAEHFACTPSVAETALAVARLGQIRTQGLRLSGDVEMAFLRPSRSALCAPISVYFV